MERRQAPPAVQPAPGASTTAAPEAPGPAGAPQGTTAGSSDLPGVLERDVPAVLRAIRQTGVEELRLSWGDLRIVLRRDPTAGDAGAPAGEAAGQPATSEDATAVLEVRAHMVGPFHRSREPDGPSLAGEGDLVAAGRALGVIETLGMATDVEAPATGRLERFVVEDGHPVEYGQVLAIIVPEA